MLLCEWRFGDLRREVRVLRERMASLMAPARAGEPVGDDLEPTLTFEEAVALAISLPDLLPR